MLRFNAENMYSELDRFEKKYKYPVYVTISVLNGVFGKEEVRRHGYAAISDDFFLLVADYKSVDSEEVIYHKLPVTGMSSVKVGKADKINMHTISVKGITTAGKKYKIKISVTGSEAGSSLPDQGENCKKFVKRLKKWSEEI